MNIETPLFTPLHLQLILHAHVTNSPYPTWELPVAREYTAELIRLGLIEGNLVSEFGGGSCSTTEKGEAFIEMLLRTPLPVQLWCAPNGKPVLNQ